MLDTVDLTQSLRKSAYKPVRKAQLARIFELSELIYEQKRPVIIVFEGWDASGKGTTIRQLTQRLDARGFKVLATQAPRTHEQRKPWLWRFWMNIPRHGQIAIFDRSWYGRVLVERVNGLTPMAQWIAAYEEINGFERTLADDGTIFLKFWLHIAKDEQLRRFMQLALEPENAWRVTAEDWENHRRYGEYLAAVSDMIDKTSTAIAPWTVVPATDGDVRLYTVCDAIITRLEAALGLEASHYPSIDALVAGKVKPAKATKAKEKKKKKKPAGSDVHAEESVTIIVEKDTPAVKKSKTGKKAKKVEHESVAAAPGESPAAVMEELPSPEPATVDGAPPPARRRKKASAVPAANAATEVDHA